jgi:hypothetical protein
LSSGFDIRVILVALRGISYSCFVGTNFNPIPDYDGLYLSAGTQPGSIPYSIGSMRIDPSPYNYGIEKKFTFDRSKSFEAPISIFSIV